MVTNHDPRPLSHIGWCFDCLDSYRGTIHRSAINRRAERSDLAGELRTEQVMDATIKEKWVKALRSGEFKQGEGKLHDSDNDTYCCLGVLCKIQGAQFTEWNGNTDEYY